jgi:hypothetical protein
MLLGQACSKGIWDLWIFKKTPDIGMLVWVRQLLTPEGHDRMGHLVGIGLVVNAQI